MQNVRCLGAVSADADATGAVLATEATVGTLATQATLATLVTAAQRKGIVVPQTDVTVSDLVAVWNAAIAIPSTVVAVRVFVDVACYVVVNATATRIANASGGAPVPADRLVDIPCVGCTYLHLAATGAGNVTFKYSYVYAS